MFIIIQNTIIYTEKNPVELPTKRGYTVLKKTILSKIGKHLINMILTNEFNTLTCKTAK